MTRPLGKPAKKRALTMTVLVTSIGCSGVEVTGAHGRIFDGAEFKGSRLVVVGERNKTKISVVYQVRRVSFDHRDLAHALNDRARAALEALLKNPNDTSANNAFRSALGPSRPTQPPPQQKSSAVGLGSPLEANCSVLAVGDGRTHSVVDAYRLGSLRLDLADLLCKERDLVRDFARHLSAPKSGRLRDNFLDEARVAIDMDDLQPMLKGIGEPVKVRDDGGVLKVVT